MNKIRDFFILSSLILLFPLTEGCETKTDSQYPEIEVSLPLSGSEFDFGDTIQFSALCSDDIQLNAIEIQLVDMDNKPMLQTLSMTPGKNPYAIAGEYIIGDPMLAGGMYQLRFKISDGINTTNKFVPVRINELIREFLYPVIVTHPQSGKWLVHKLQNDNVWKEIHSHTGDYAGSDVNSAASQFYICGIYLSDLTAIKLTDGNFLWSVKHSNHQSLRWFEGISFSYPLLYIPVSEGNIRGYNTDGKEIYKTAKFANAVPKHSVLTKNYIVGAFRDNFSNDRFVVAFHNTGGAMIYNNFLNADVAELVTISGDRVLVFSNRDGQGEILLYNGSDNTLLVQHLFYEGTFRSAVAMDTENYIISTSAGIYRYQLSNNSLTPFVSTHKNGVIACDNISQQVYAASGRTLDVYSFPFASLTESYSLPDTIVDMHLVYNK